VIVNGNFYREWEYKGHVYGECMSQPGTDLMYVHIPKNASSWTKPNLRDFGWEFFNYRTDHLDKHAIVVLRDPVDRWLSGIAEYMYLYHRNIDFAFVGRAFFDLVFDRITFDDHTEHQVKFIDGLDTNKCTFFMCGKDYAENFGRYIEELYGPNRYASYAPQHVSELSDDRRRFKKIFQQQLTNSKYLEQIKNHFAADYQLIDSVQFYGTR